MTDESEKWLRQQRQSPSLRLKWPHGNSASEKTTPSPDQSQRKRVELSLKKGGSLESPDPESPHSYGYGTRPKTGDVAFRFSESRIPKPGNGQERKPRTGPQEIPPSRHIQVTAAPSGNHKTQSRITIKSQPPKHAMVLPNQVTTKSSVRTDSPPSHVTPTTSTATGAHVSYSTHGIGSTHEHKAKLNTAVSGEEPFEVSFSQLPGESIAVLSMSDGQMSDGQTSDGQTHVQTHDVEGSWVNVVKTDTPQEESKASKMLLHDKSVRQQDVDHFHSPRKQPQAQGGPEEDVDPTARHEGEDRMVLYQSSLKPEQFVHMESQKKQPQVQREDLDPTKQPRAQREDLDPTKQPQAQGGSKEDPSIRVLRRLKDEAREERDKALQENELLKQGIELARASTKKVTDDLRASYEVKLQEQQAMLQEAEQKLTTEQQRSKHRYQFELQRKETECRERIASMQNSSDASSKLQVLEAQYQREIQQLRQTHQQKDRNLEAEISELKSTKEQATQRERETRAEMRRMQEQFQAELKRREDQQQQQQQQQAQSLTQEANDSLGHNELSSGQCFGQPQAEDNDGDKVLVAERSLYHKDYSRMTSQASSSDSSVMAERLQRMASESSDGERIQRDVGGAIGLKDQEIETLTEQLKLKEERITALNVVIVKNQETAKRGLRTGDVDSYTEQVTSLAEQLSKYDESDRRQKSEIAKLQLKVREAEEVEKQYVGTTMQISQYAEENKALRERLSRLEREGAARLGDREQLQDGTIASLQSEIQRLQPFEAQVQQLGKALNEHREYRKMAADYQGRLTQTQGELEQKKREIARLQEVKPPLSVDPDVVVELQREISGLKKELQSKQQEMHHRRGVESTPVAMGTDTTRLMTQVAHLKKQLGSKDAQISELERENASLLSGSSHAQWLRGEVAKLKKEVETKENEILRMQMEMGRHEPSSSTPEQPVSSMPELAVSKATSPSPEVAELQQALREKEDTLVKLSEQLRQFQKTAKDLTKIVEHSKGQSKVVKDLKEELAKEKGEKSELLAQKDELHVAKESVQAEIDSLQKSRGGLETALIASRNTNDRLREEREKLKTKNKLADSQLRELQGVNGQLRDELATLQEKARVSLDTALRDRAHWQQKSISQQANLDNMAQDLAQKRREVTQMSATVGEQGNELQRLGKQNTDLLSEVEVHRVTAQTFQEDFTQERKDREQAHSRFADMEKHYTEQLEAMGAQLQLTRHELDTHKQSLTNMEAMFQTKVNQMKQELASANAQGMKLHEEVLSKTQQVKQYKKQVDQLKEEMEAYRVQSEVHKEQVEFFARKTDEQNHELTSLKLELEKLRREKDAAAQDRTRYADGTLQRESSRREAFERKSADLERMNDQLKIDIRVENDRLKQRIGNVDPTPQRPYPPPAQPHPSTHPPPYVDPTSQRPYPPQSIAQPHPSTRPPTHIPTYPAGAKSDHLARIQRQQGKSYSVDDPRLNARGEQPHKAATSTTRGGTYPPNTSHAILPSRVGLVQAAMSNNHYPNSGVPPVLQLTPYTQPGLQRQLQGGGGGQVALYTTQPGLNEHQRQLQGGGGQPGLNEHQRQLQGGRGQPGLNEHQRQLQGGRGQPGLNEHQRQLQGGRGQPGLRDYYHNIPGATPGLSSLPSGLTEHGYGQKQPTHRGQPHGDDGTIHTPGDLVERDSPPSSFVSNQPQMQRPRKPVSQQLYNTSDRFGGGDWNQRHMQETISNAPQVDRQHLLGNPQYRHQPNSNVAVGPGPPMRNRHDAPPRQHDKFPTQETQPHPQALKPSSSQVQPSHVHSKPPVGRQGSQTQPHSGLGQSGIAGGDSNTLLTGIDRDIYHVAKNVVQKDPLSSSSAQEDIPYDPNLTCPRCGQQYRLGQIQKFRKHVSSCQSPAK